MAMFILWFFEANIQMERPLFLPGIKIAFIIFCEIMHLMGVAVVESDLFSRLGCPCPPKTAGAVGCDDDKGQSCIIALPWLREEFPPQLSLMLSQLQQAVRSPLSFQGQKKLLTALRAKNKFSLGMNLQGDKPKGHCGPPGRGKTRKHLVQSPLPGFSWKALHFRFENFR